MTGGLLAADFDLDGDLDLVQTCADGGPLRVLDNQQSPDATNGYLLVRPRMTGANQRAIGAVVEITAGTLTMTRLITAGTSFLSQEPAEAFFGLGAATIVDTVTVRWPGGGTTTLQNVAANQVLDVCHEPCSGDLDGDGNVNAADLAVLLGAWGPNPGHPADLNDDGFVNAADLANLLGAWGPCP